MLLEASWVSEPRKAPPVRQQLAWSDSPAHCLLPSCPAWWLCAPQLKASQPHSPEGEQAVRGPCFWSTEAEQLRACPSPCSTLQPPSSIPIVCVSLSFHLFSHPALSFPLSLLLSPLSLPSLCMCGFIYMYTHTHMSLCSSVSLSLYLSASF